MADHLRKRGAGKPKSRHRWQRRPEVLLCPNIPKPLHGTAPRVVLGSAWWDRTRRAAYESTDFHCVACGVHKYQQRGRTEWLEGHEIYDIDYGQGRMMYVETVPLCRFCHLFIHDGRLRALVEKGIVHQRHFVAVMRHGSRVLAEAGLQRVSHAQREEIIGQMIVNGKVAAWKDWRLVVDGKEYNPRLKSEAHWERTYGAGTD